MAEQIIQGILTKWRDLRNSSVTEDGELIEGEEVLYANCPQDEQYFRRIDHPFTDDELVAIANKEHEYTQVQKQWLEREKKRIEYGEGVYVMINGVLTYIPGSYWGYINHWILEHGEKPEYREADRIFFLFMEYICFETDILAITRGKGRRQGATSIGFYWMWWICGRLPEKKGGSISFNDAAAQKNFQTMFMRGFKAMLPCFIEDFDTSAENFVRFVKPLEKAKKGVIQKREGLNSYCDFLPNSINSYDSGRLSYGLFDEGGKWEKTNINTFWSKVSATLKIGRKKVGFSYIPTTVNPKNKGGENYEQFWKDANQNAINPETDAAYGLNTPHKVIRYFVPATEGYAGCIDKFGYSVIDDPEEPIMGNDGAWITEGAKTVILRERKLKRGDQLLEHRRDFPLDEYDMFAFSTGSCEFDEERLIEQIQYLEENPAEAFWRQGRISEKINEETDRLEVEFFDDKRGEWWIKEFPPEPNKYSRTGEHLQPENTLLFSSGADTYKNIFAEKGSDGCICIFKKSNIVNGIETGLYPVAFFIGRPRLIKQFNRQALLGCLWYGCKINYELDAGSWYYEDFEEWHALRFLEWEPARDPLKRDKIIKPGTESGNPFQLAKQLEVAKLYFDGNRIDTYNGNCHRVKYLPLLKEALNYNHSERLPYHTMVAFMMALLPCMASYKPPQKTERTKFVLPTYKLKNRA